MAFEIRPITEADYDNILLEWWKDWKWTAPTKDFLPDNGTGGLIVFDGETPICAGYLYATNSKVAWIDWIISSKTYRKKPERQNAIGLLIETLTNIASNTGYSFGYALIKHQGLIETYEKTGYISSGKYNTEMIKKL